MVACYDGLACGDVNELVRREDNIMKSLKYYVNLSIYEPLIALGLISTSLSIVTNNILLYGVALVLYTLKLYKCSAYGKLTDANVLPFLILYLGSIFISNSMNMIFDSRYFLFMLLFIVTMPFFCNKYIIEFKEKVLRYTLYSFILVSVVCFVCYIIGYNGPVLLDENVNPLDFKGITVHPMWLSPICGISTIACSYFFLDYQSKKVKFFWLILLALSLFTGVAAASRSALLSSILGSVFILYIKSKNKIVFIKRIVIVAFLAVACIPYFDSERMSNKMEVQMNSKETSRDYLWKERLEEIEYSPFFGVGFAASGTTKKEVGRMESGSGWLTVISQTGLWGFIFLCLILKSAIVRNKKFYKEGYLLLYSAEFLFLCIHSFFEGYLYTPGYNLCFFFWLILGVIISKNEMLRRRNLVLIKNQHQ